MIPVNINEVETLARDKLMAYWHYVAGGAEDETSIRDNRNSFRRIRLVPRVLTDGEAPDLKSTLLGSNIDLPVIIAPTSPQKLVHAGAEIATARGAARAGVIAICSTDSHYSIADIRAASTESCLWYQLYCYKNRSIVERMVEFAAMAKCSALVLTVDANHRPRRERMIRSAFSIPNHIKLGNLAAAGISEAETKDLKRVPLTWSDLDWLRKTAPMPLLIKGVLSAEDALIAADLGLDGIVVSNHGGRQLDCAVAPLDVLPEIAQRVKGKLTLLADGGIRRGSDIVKAIALGADAVLVGRPALWGLAMGGEQGVADVINMLRDELLSCMQQLGCNSIKQLDSSYLLRR